MMRTAFRMLGAAAAVLAAAACGDSNGPPSPGKLEVTLATPNADDGAVLLTVTGGAIDSASVAGSGARVFASAASAGAQVVVTGALADGPIATLHIPDEDRASDYSVRATQVGVRGTYALRDTAGYRLTLRKR